MRATLAEATGGAALRIIAGTHRGRRLAPPPPGVRPTSDRVRESIFARLGDVTECRVLDLYAGTGALGLEALSRGASSLVCVDKSLRSLRVLRRNLAQLELEARVSVIHDDARGAIGQLSESSASFDLVFLDPPYESEEAARALELLVSSGVLSHCAVVVVETAKRHPVAPVQGLHLEQSRSYGDTAVCWLVRETGKDSQGGVEER